MAGKATRSVADRLWEKADIRGEDACWNWVAARDGRGLYGLFYRHGRLVGAHVAAYELMHGPVPEGMHVDHRCNNPACINPAHLRPLTPRDNVLRSSGRSAENHRKAACKNGHAFTADNTRIDARGARICRICDTANSRARYAKKGTDA